MSLWPEYPQTEIKMFITLPAHKYAALRLEPYLNSVLYITRTTDSCIYSEKAVTNTWFLQHMSSALSSI